MWFKNLRIYNLQDDFQYSPEELNLALSKFEFTPCGSMEPSKYGWTTPLGGDSSELVHAANGYIMVCAKRQEKVLPSSIVKELLDEKISEISAREGRSIRSSEKQSLKEEIVFSLLPKALVKSAYDFAYVDPKKKLIVVNATSAGRAEDIISLLREALGSLRATALMPLNTPREVMTGWLMGEKVPEAFEVGEECELSSMEEGRSIRFKQQNLWINEVNQHIASGLQVAKLAVKWNDSIDCIIDEQFCFKRLKYANDITDKADDHSVETAAERFDVDFSIMTIELSEFIEAALSAFGGFENKAQ